MAMAPWTQASPRWGLFLTVPPFQAASQAAMPDLMPARLLRASSWTAAAGRLTEVSPISFIRGALDVELTVDSAKATELDVPSTTVLIDLDCCQAKSPVVFMVDRLATLAALEPRMSVVVPIEPK